MKNRFKDVRNELVPFLVKEQDGERVGTENNRSKIEIFCPICGEINEKQIGTFVKNGLNEKNCIKCNSFQTHFPNLIIFLINKEDGKLSYQSNKKILCKCPSCDEEKEYTIQKLGMRGFYCNNCVSIKEKHPELVKYLINEEDSNLSYGSNKRVKCICPNCKTEKEMVLQSLVNQGFYCPKCSDGFSIPEKFMFAILEELNIDFQKEYSPLWNKEKRYDFYISSLNMIIETHGAQHYEKSSWTNLEKVKNNDTLKKEHAIQNGVINYIEIDCRKSEKDFLIKNIKNSLKNLIDLSTLNFDEIWISINENNLILNICNDYKENILTIEEISYKYKISITTIYDYLKRFDIKLRSKKVE